MQDQVILSPSEFKLVLCTNKQLKHREACVVQ